MSKERSFFFRMCDSKLSPRDIKRKFSWQACKKVMDNDKDKSDSVINYT